jgi:hypothetical protein
VHLQWNNPAPSLRVEYLPNDQRVQLGVYTDGWGSAWLALFEQAAEVRTFNLATDIFVDKVSGPDFSQLQEISAKIPQSTLGQRAVLEAQRARIQGLQRASTLQGQTRGTYYAQGVAQASSTSNVLAKGIAMVNNLLQRFEPQGVPPLAGGDQFNFDTGTWQDGKMI